MSELVDQAYQRFYAQAYKLMKLYWAIRRPRTHGALVAIWHAGSILLVRQSYLSYYSLPGGYVKDGEDARAAAVREAREELGIELADDQLTPALEIVQEWNQHLDHVEIFEVELFNRPAVKIDNREVISAEFYSQEEAQSFDLFPPIRAILERKLAR